MSAAVLSSSIHSDSIVDAVSLTMSVMVGMLMQGQSQAWRVQGVPAEEQEPGKAPGEKGRMIRSVLALYLLAPRCHNSGTSILICIRAYHDAFSALLRVSSC
jgi:hypothetical protein